MYLQKSLLGGILIFEIFISEPFFYTKLHALEASRIQQKMIQSVTGKNFVSTFLDECDRIKVLIDLHSFTYDYHLKTIQSHIELKPSNLQKGFHIVSFWRILWSITAKGLILHTNRCSINREREFARKQICMGCWNGEQAESDTKNSPKIFMICKINVSFYQMKSDIWN